MASVEYEKVDEIVKAVMKYVKKEWKVKDGEMDVIFEECLRRVVLDNRVKGSFGK